MSGEGWYVQTGGTTLGPMSTPELLGLHSGGRIAADTLVSKDERNWMEARHFPGFSGPAASSDSSPGSMPESPTGTASAATPFPPPPPLPLKREAGSPQRPVSPTPGSSVWLETGKRQATEIIADLRKMDFRREIIPIDETNFGRLVKDGIFWFATLLGVVPLAIVTLPEGNAQLTAFAMFFAAVWGVIFRSAILKDNSPWGILLASLFFTGLIGTTAAGKIEELLLTAVPLVSPSLVTLLVVFVLVVGVVEEACKLVPVVGYLLWKRRAARPMTAVLVGVFSGLGFAAFENLMYSEQAIASTLAATKAAGEEGLVVGVQSAMATAMLRSLSLVFCHAVWAGIFAYFLAAASTSGKRWGAMFLVGFGLTAVLHGLYNWLSFVQPTLAAFTAGLSFILFYGYVAKIRGTVGAAVEDVRPCPSSLPSDA